MAGSGAQKRQGRKINNSDVDSAVLQSALAADLHRAMLVAKVRQEAEKDLPTLTKAELAELLFEQVGLNKREAKDMVETFFDEIRNALERGEAVKLSGFGNFQLRDKPQRPGRNPKTGEEILVRFRQFPVARQAAAAGPQSEDGRRDSHHGAPCRDLSCEPEAEKHGRRDQSAGTCCLSEWR